MTAGGNIGLTQAASKPWTGNGPFTQGKPQTSVTIHITDALPWTGGLQRNPIYFFTNYGTLIESTYPDASGNAYAYDWDDGAYYADQTGTGNAWSITVSGTTVTITRISSLGTPISIYAA